MVELCHTLIHRYAALSTIRKLSRYSENSVKNEDDSSAMYFIIDAVIKQMVLSMIELIKWNCSVYSAQLLCFMFIGLFDILTVLT